MLWFFLWRTALWGAGLCAFSVAACASGVLVAYVVFDAVSNSGTPDSGASNAAGAYVLGAVVVFSILGAAFGLILGLLDGLVLFTLTRAFFQPRLGDPARYGRMSGWTCAGAAAVALLADWLINSYPNADDFGLFRFTKDSMATATSTGLSAPELLVYVLVPTLVLSVPMWFSGRKVADRYVREARKAGSGGGPPVGDRRPETG